MKMKILTSICFVCSPLASFGADEINIKSVYEKAYNHVLKIDVEEIISAYGTEQNSTGSGFWLGGGSRLIVTNAHVAVPNSISQLEAQDGSGNKFPVKLVYSNPLIDLAYLMPEEEAIIQPESHYDFCTKPELNSNVFMLGNNGGGGIVLQDGRVSDTCAIETANYPLKSITVSVNGKGGSSGSMVINQRGEIIGINYAASDIASFAIPVECMIEDLSYLKEGVHPPKKDIGLIFKHIREKEARDYYKFNLESSKIYNQEFEGAQSRLVQVASCIMGTSGEIYFEPGDIITHVEETLIGPDLFKYYHSLNQLKTDTVNITFFRHGEKMIKSIPLYDLNHINTPDMIIFGKAVFSPTNIICSVNYGVSLNSVGMFQNPSGNIFNGHINSSSCENGVDVSAFIFKKIDNQMINNLDDLERIIPRLVENSKFTYTAEDHLQSNQKVQIFHTQYNAEYHQTPVRMTYDKEMGKWKKKEIK